MATLVVDRSSSTCEECGKSASPWQTVHDEAYGFNPGPGCGAVFDKIRSNYFGLNMKQWAAENRPDLEWVGFDEEFGG